MDVLFATAQTRIGQCNVSIPYNRGTALDRSHFPATLALPHRIVFALKCRIGEIDSESNAQKIVIPSNKAWILFPLLIKARDDRVPPVVVPMLRRHSRNGIKGRNIGPLRNGNESLDGTQSFLRPEGSPQPFYGIRCFIRVQKMSKNKFAQPS